MLDVSLGELALISVVAVVAIGPKELPAVLRGLGRVMSHLRALSGEFHKGFDELLHESELAEAQKELTQDFDYIIDQNGHRQRVYDITDVADASRKPLPPPKEQGDDDNTQ